MGRRFRDKTSGSPCHLSSRYLFRPYGRDEGIRLQKDSTGARVPVRYQAPNSNMCPFLNGPGLYLNCSSPYRDHGWVQPVWRPAGCPEVHPYRNHPGHCHHLCCLYPTQLGGAHPGCGGNIAGSMEVATFSGGSGWAMVGHHLARDSPSFSTLDISSVVLFGACIEGVVLRDK